MVPHRGAPCILVMDTHASIPAFNSAHVTANTKSRFTGYAVAFYGWAVFNYLPRGTQVTAESINNNPSSLPALALSVAFNFAAWMS